MEVPRIQYEEKTFWPLARWRGVGHSGERFPGTDAVKNRLGDHLSGGF